MTPARNQKLSDNERCVIEALKLLTNERGDPDLFFNSRDIANCSGLNIYQTRYILLKLCEKEIVLKGRSDPEKRQPWRWKLKYNALQPQNAAVY